MGNEGASLPAVLAAMPRPAGAPPVSVQPMPWTAAHAKLLTGFAGGSLPAIGQVGNSWLAEMAAIGAIAPVPRTLHGLLADPFDAVVDTNRIAGRLWEVPWYETGRASGRESVCQYV